MTTTTVRHEVEIDTRIAAALVAVRKAKRHVEWCKKLRGRTGVPTVESAEAALDEAQAALDDLTPLYGGWSRFTIVPGGHIHTWDGCHTLRWTTDVRWLPELSGLTEADAVEAHGEILCSHCFPTAPVAWTNGQSKQSIADKALKAIAKTPEGKAVVKAQRDLDWHQRDIDYAIGRVAAETEWRDRLLAQGDTEGADAATARMAASQKVIAKATKAMAKAQAKLDAATTALDAALAVAADDAHVVEVEVAGGQTLTCRFID
jgi:hypothetical protein